jgi:hypothetical protein
MTLKTIALLAALVMAGPSLAHEAKGKHGGRVADAGDYHVELVAKGSTVEVYVADYDDKPVTTRGYKGLAILAVDGKSQRIVLEETDIGKLTGKATGNLPAQPKGVVQITPPGGKAVSAKF